MEQEVLNGELDQREVQEIHKMKQVSQCNVIVSIVVNSGTFFEHHSEMCAVELIDINQLQFLVP